MNGERAPGAGRKPSPQIAERNDRIIRRYRDGASLSECALDFGLSVRMIRKVLSLAGVEMRPAGKPQSEARSEEENEAARKKRAAYNKVKLAEYLADPANAEERKQYMADYIRKRRKDPEKAEMDRKSSMEYLRRRALRRFASEAKIIEGKLNDQ